MISPCNEPIILLFGLNISLVRDNYVVVTIQLCRCFQITILFFQQGAEVFPLQHRMHMQKKIFLLFLVLFF